MSMMRIAPVAALTLALAGCFGGETKTQVAECTYPDSAKDAAPGWICDQPVDGLEVSAVGYADKSGAGINFMKQQAATAARVQLAQMMQVQVQNMIKQYAETTGVGDAETVDQVNTSVTKQLTSETLVGTRIYKTQASPAGNLYVLVGIDPNAATKIRETALKTSMNNEKALWQKFQANKSFDELSKEMAEFKNQQ
ncbi:MAG: LPP20 family lipoprotein [Oceanospirillaceae bacterium]|nr:LPP20 family lipoprotein [Oceanospirillaceae bacterium]MCP5335660.1 LPP20 family lipoprotein [Oceanospirillaceae bacterium]MCP5350315.1 LPP20 family lipoprotein [Oceanospirillaceae bacterium]